MIYFGISIFLSAFLLFSVQPMLAKSLLPFFGGTPAVWLCNVFFFQSTLLLGYGYAFLLSRYFKIYLQVIIHSTLLLLSLLFLPLNPLDYVSATYSPLAVFFSLLQTILLPAIAICATSPLFQHWFCLCYQSDFPGRYYALSNAGSLLGLVAFVLLIEPYLALSFQLQVWSMLYVWYLLSALACLWLLFTKGTMPVQARIKSYLGWQIPMRWLLLSATSTALLLATTQILLQDIASFPLLWVVPLALYLISYILTFARIKHYRAGWILLFALMALLIFYQPSHHSLSLKSQAFLYCTLLFSGCMICHGELVRLQPQKHQLTHYYLMIALGGVMGSIGISFVAPMLLQREWDFYFILFVIFGYCAYIIYQTPLPSPIKFLTHTISLLYLFTWLWLFYGQQKDNAMDVIYQGRNFLGSFTITERNPKDPLRHYRTLNHGNILHGQQFITSNKRYTATTYYSETSGIGLAMAYQRQQNSHPLKGLRIGAIGLGTGTVAALTQKGDLLRFYEIDPDIEKIAKKYFSYLKDSPALIDVVIADGRLALKKQWEKSGSENYDIILVDAFSGDAIPIHLMTLEAINLYLAHLAPQGILAFHISSRYVDLYPPLQAVAKKLNLLSYIVHNQGEFENWVTSAEWILISPQAELGAFLYDKQALAFRSERTSLVWTDDFSHLLGAIRW